MSRKSFCQVVLESPRFYPILLGVTLALGLAIRLKYVFSQRLWPDEALYAWYAQQLVANPAFIFSREMAEYHPPLFAGILAIGHLFLPGETACRLIPVLINLVGVALMYFVGKKISGPFGGMLAAIWLGFNILYISQSVHVLIDSPLMVALLLLLWVMLRGLDSPGRRMDIFIGIAGSLMILLKWSGVLAVGVVVVYYGLVLPARPGFNRWRAAWWPLGMMGAVIVLLLLNHFWQWGHWLPDTTALGGMYQIRPVWYYLKNLHNIFMLPLLVPCLFYGLWFLGRRRKPEDVLLLYAFGLFFLGISLTPEKDLRYGLLILPSGLLIAGIGLGNMISRMKKAEFKAWAKLTVLAATVFFYAVSFSKMTDYLDQDSQHFVGFKEAGAVIKKQAVATDLVMAGSPRLIRYYGENNRIMPLPRDWENFSKLVANDQRCWLVVDHWERTQPGWIFPLDDSRMKRLEGLGFQLREVVKKNIRQQDRVVERPVVWIFVKEPRSQ